MIRIIVCLFAQAHTAGQAADKSRRQQSVQIGVSTTLFALSLVHAADHQMMICTQQSARQNQS